MDTEIGQARGGREPGQHAGLDLGMRLFPHVLILFDLTATTPGEEPVRTFVGFYTQLGKPETA